MKRFFVILAVLVILLTIGSPFKLYEDSPISMKIPTHKIGENFGIDACDPSRNLYEANRGAKIFSKRFKNFLKTSDDYSRLFSALLDDQSTSLYPKREQFCLAEMYVPKAGFYDLHDFAPEDVVDIQVGEDTISCMSKGRAIPGYREGNKFYTFEDSFLGLQAFVEDRKVKVDRQRRQLERKAKATKLSAEQRNKLSNLKNEKEQIDFFLTVLEDVIFVVYSDLCRSELAA